MASMDNQPHRQVYSSLAKTGIWLHWIAISAGLSWFGRIHEYSLHRIATQVGLPGLTESRNLAPRDSHMTGLSVFGRKQEYGSTR